ncbi:MAG: alpha/beta fold hydrolase, partial [Pseudolysinimonas sp.]
MPIDPAAVIWSTPVGDRSGKPLLVLLHGLGSHEGDLFQLSPYLPLDHVIASPRGPIQSGTGWSWFDVAATRPAPLNESADEFAEWLATVRGDASSVAVLGFSQGGVLGLQALRRHPELIDSLVLLS